MKYAAGNRVDIYYNGAPDEAGVITKVDPKSRLYEVLIDTDDDLALPDTAWFEEHELRREGDDDPGYDPSPTGDEGKGMFPTFALID